jgi:hypothetical protein
MDNLFILSTSSSIKSILLINGDECFQIHLSKERPNLWWRFWQWIFFGFKWKKL